MRIGIGIRAARVLRGLGSLIVVAALLVGVPVSLILLVGNPLPRSVPDWSAVMRDLDHGTIPAEVMAKVVAAVVWFWWIQVVIAFLGEGLAAIRGTTARRMPVMPGVQVIAARVVAGLILSFTALGAVPRVAWAEPITVVSGDSLWNLAEEHLGDPLRWPEIFEMNRDRLPEGFTFDDPNLIYPGWILEIPTEPAPTEPAPTDQDIAAEGAVATELREVAAPAPAPAHPPPAAQAAAPARPLIPVARSAFDEQPSALDTVPDPPEASRDAGAKTVATATGLAIVAGGLVATIGRIRSAQRRRRNPGEHVRRPPVRAQQTEQFLVAVADVQALGTVGDALCALDSALEGQEAPPIVGISHGTGRVTFLLESKVEAPPPFGTIDDGFAWEIAASDLVVDPARVWAGRAPEILTTAGWHEGSDSTVLLNLGQIGHLRVSGEEGHVLPALTTMAAELATSPFAEGLVVACVGFGWGLGHLERVRLVERLSDVVADLEDAPVEESSGLVTVVLDPFTEEPNVLERLDRLTGERAVAVTAHGDTYWKLVCRQSAVTLWPVDLTLQRRDLDAAAIEDLGEVLEAAGSAEGEEPDPEFELGMRDLRRPEPEVVVSVLGSIQVQGIDREFNSRVALALVTYLAFHRDGATADELKRWLWHPDSPPSDKLFANTVSRARTTLGVGDDGMPHLPRVGSDRLYRLADGVGTDVDRFRAFVDAADEDPVSTRKYLRCALELVRGLAFAGGDDQPFAWVDHTIRSHVEFLVDEASHRLADEALAAGDPAEARWAALSGLRLIPDCESCFRRRFLAADLAGNRTELKRAMSELRRLVAIDAALPDASDLISPDLEDLYATLLAGRALAV